MSYERTRQQDRSTIDLQEWRYRIRPAVAERAEFRCEECGRFVGMHGDVDHMVPRSHCDDAMIDPRDPANLQYLCKSCHSKKTNRERMSGRPPKDRSAMRRARVSGRKAFLQALSEGSSRSVQAIAQIPVTVARNDYYQVLPRSFEQT